MEMGLRGWNIFKRARVLLIASCAALGLCAVKAAMQHFGLEFLSLSQLFASTIAGAIFILGFQLRGALADYKEAERLPGEIRVALEALHGDIVNFKDEMGRTVDLAALERRLAAISHSTRSVTKSDDLSSQIKDLLAEVDALSQIFVELEAMGMPANYIVRLRTTQDALRRSLLRIYHIQHIRFVPSAHILAQALVLAIVMLMLFLKTTAAADSMLMFGVITFMLIYVLLLIETLERPFGDAERSYDDVSLFLLRELEEKLANTAAARPTPSRETRNAANPG